MTFRDVIIPQLWNTCEMFSELHPGVEAGHQLLTRDGTHPFVSLLVYLKAMVSTSVLTGRTFWRGECTALGAGRMGHGASALKTGLL